jgi:flagellar hook protein FlgE
MNVIGNNISNINTIGFKKGRVTFKDMLYQQSAAASRPTETLGGVNPKETGLGVQVGAIDTIQTQGSLQTTGVGSDLAIQGNGFFILNDGDQRYYTRAGDFGVDSNGNFVNPSNGMFVQGWQATTDANGNTVVNTSADAGKINIPVGGKDPAHATQNVDFMCNLDKRMNADGSWGTSIKVYDSFGNQHTLQIQMTPVYGAPDANGVSHSQNVWNATVYVDPAVNPATGQMADGANMNTATGPSPAAGAANVVPAAGAGNTYQIYFSNLGQLEGVVPGAALPQNTNAAPPAAIAAAAQGTPVTLNVAYDVPNTTNGVPERQNMVLNLGTVGGLENSVTQYAEQSTTKAFKQDGYAMGYLSNYNIDSTGTINGIYTNGTSRVLGQIALASFTNQNGLTHAGDTAFQESTNSGTANIGTCNTQGRGKITAGALEMSNVDMSDSFVDMITTERGFQANSKTITTSDEMLQTLLQLKQ